MDAKLSFLSVSIFFFSFHSVRAAPAPPPPSPWARAQRDYDAGRFARAEEIFGSLLSSGSRPSAALEYDLGNSLYREGRLGPAVAAYLRAYRILPRDPDIVYNLAFTLQKAGETLVPEGVPSPIFHAFHFMSLQEIAGTFWLLSWLLFVAGGVMLLRGGTRALWPIPGRRRMAAASALAAWCFFGLWWAGRALVRPPGLAVIVAPQAELRSGPGDGFAASFTVPEGRRVTVMGSAGSWLEVGTLKEGVEGWVRSGGVERLDPVR